ncbi:MAG: protein-glutamate O-methyltransferase CheR [Cyanobacteria bacterium SZAS-4]|nr:protein-glutamate O-methyltransferase CheR [Cyanobacteria bacterium SZAS-4]
MTGSSYEHADSNFDLPIVQSITATLLDKSGFDLSVYSDTFIRRRLFALINMEGLDGLDDLHRRISTDSKLLKRLLQSLPIYTTELFRDPPFFKNFRQEVVPILKTYPYLRIWHAGCSTGEEAYSMAILLKEEGLYDRSKIYATDLHAPLLEKARAGIYPIRWLQGNADNYIKAGGAENFSMYYTLTAKHVVLDPSLKRNIVFAQHNLTTDGVFNEFNVILCRNVLIYFNWTFQRRVHSLLHESLILLGLLGLGNNESIRGSGMEVCYKQTESKVKLYQKVN